MVSTDGNAQAVSGNLSESVGISGIKCESVGIIVSTDILGTDLPWWVKICHRFPLTPHRLPLMCLGLPLMCHGLPLTSHRFPLICTSYGFLLIYSGLPVDSYAAKTACGKAVHQCCVHGWWGTHRSGVQYIWAVYTHDGVHTSYGYSTPLLCTCMMGRTLQRGGWSTHP